MIVSEIMTENPATIAPDATIGEALDILQDLQIRHLPVVDNTALVGMVSDRDLRAQNVRQFIGEEAVGEVHQNLDAPVSRIMNGNVHRVDPSSEVSDVVDIMIEHRVGAVPVVDEATGDLRGIVSYIDVLQGLQDLL